MNNAIDKAFMSCLESRMLRGICNRKQKYLRGSFAWSVGHNPLLGTLSSDDDVNENVRKQ